MKINVIAKTNAKKPEIIKIDDNTFNVAVSATAEKGKANAAIIKALADYFDIAKSQINILSGKKSKNKVLEIKIVKSS